MSTMILPVGTKYKAEINGALSETVTVTEEISVRAWVIEGPVHVYETADGTTIYVNAEDEVSTVSV